MECMERQIYASRGNGIYLLVSKACPNSLTADIAAAIVADPKYGISKETLGVYTQADNLSVKKYEQLRHDVESPAESGVAGLGWVATMSDDDGKVAAMQGSLRLKRQAELEDKFFSSHENLRALRNAGKASASAVLSTLKDKYMELRIRLVGLEIVVRGSRLIIFTEKDFPKL